MQHQTGYRQALLIAFLVAAASSALARDDFVWISYGGQQGYFESPYVGVGFMADTWGAELGLVLRSDYNGTVNHYDPPHNDTTRVQNNAVVGFPLHLSILKGYAPNDRIAFYTSLGFLASTRCDIEQSNVTNYAYCANERAEFELVPGVSALFSLGEFTLGMGYQYGIGPLISLGTDF
ncbi:hypothetical protein [Saccharospirillum impatiens]|uniref:hypothetical protein n=1 Tax=Saccharospirillum impatiens TaxID=169438 RepID=UPI00042371F3|nr:hypothetical protein [Saccharospirillum impatiens]